MRLAKAPRKRALIGLTSLIDVIFLLLLFFMLTSTFMRYTQLDMGVATAGPGAPTRLPLLVRLNDNGTIALNGRKIEMSELKKQISYFTSKGVTAAVLVPKGDVKVQDLVATLETLKHSNLKTVSLSR